MYVETESTKKRKGTVVRLFWTYVLIVGPVIGHSSAHHTLITS